MPILRSFLCAAILSLISFVSQADVPVLTFTMKPFDVLILHGGHEVEIVQGEGFRVQVQGEDLSSPLVLQSETKVSLGRADLRRPPIPNMKYRVEMPQLARLNIRGSGRVFVKPFSTVEPVAFNVEGSGSLYLYDWNSSLLNVRLHGSGNIEFAELKSDRVSVNIGGSGSLVAGEAHILDLDAAMAGSGELVLEDSETSVQNLRVNIAGSGGMEAEQIDFSVIQANIMGSGDLRIGKAARITANIIGSGSVYYRGNAVTEVSVLGSGSVERVDE